MAAKASQTHWNKQLPCNSCGTQKKNRNRCSLQPMSDHIKQSCPKIPTAQEYWPIMAITHPLKFPEVCLQMKLKGCVSSIDPWQFGFTTWFSTSSAQRQLDQRVRKVWHQHNNTNDVIIFTKLKLAYDMMDSIILFDKVEKINFWSQQERARISIKISMLNGKVEIDNEVGSIEMESNKVLFYHLPSSTCIFKRCEYEYEGHNGLPPQVTRINGHTYSFLASSHFDFFPFEFRGRGVQRGLRGIQGSRGPFPPDASTDIDMMLRAMSGHKRLNCHPARRLKKDHKFWVSHKGLKQSYLFFYLVLSKDNSFQFFKVIWQL